MRGWAGRFACGAAFAAALTARAGADDLKAVTAKLGLAAAGVKSFVVEMRVNGTTGVNGTLTFVRPLSIKSEFSMGPMAVETYMVDGTLYMHAPTGGWQKMRIDAAQTPALSANIADSLKTAKVTLMPDRQEDGTTVGVIAVDAQLPALSGTPGQAGPQQIVCSYDKVSYLMKICTNSLMTMTYTKYNDPANVVVLPPEAKTAVPMPAPSFPPPAALATPAAPATPAASASPGPAASAALPAEASPPPGQPVPSAAPSSGPSPLV